MDVYNNFPVVARVLRLFPVSEPRFKEISIMYVLSPSHLPEVMISLTPSPLEAFSISPIGLVGFCTQDQLNDFLSAVGTHFSPKLLTHLSYGGWRLLQLAEATIISSTLLRPLFVFSNFRRFSLQSYHFDHTDAEVKELAMLLPLLEALHIGESSVIVQPRFLRFAIYCRNLDNLSVNFTGIDTFYESELAMTSGHPLRYLSVGHSTPSLSLNPKKYPSLSTPFFQIIWYYCGGMKKWATRI